jgi:hypothetical protein
MTINIIAPSPEGGRVTEIAVGVLFGILLIGAICGTCYYVRKRRIRARLEQNTIDMERGLRDGSIRTLDDNREKDLGPENDEEVDVNNGGRDGSVAQPSHHRNGGLSTGDRRSADSSTYETVYNTALDFELQLSKRETAHLKN